MCSDPSTDEHAHFKIKTIGSRWTVAGLYGKGPRRHRLQETNIARNEIIYTDIPSVERSMLNVRS